MVSLLMSRGLGLFGRVAGVVLLPCILLLQSCTQGGTGPSAPTYEVPPGVDPTGATDVTAQLQAFLDTVPDNSTIVLRAGTTYRIESPLTLTNRTGLTFEGNGATILATTNGAGTIPPDCISVKCRFDWLRERSQWKVIGGSNIVFRTMTVHGANPNAGMGDAAYVDSLEAQHGFEFDGVDGVELDGVIVTDTYGDFVDLAGTGGAAGTLTRNVRIHNSHFERNGRQGIAITGAEDVLIDNNWIGQTRRGTFDFEPSTAAGVARRIIVRGNIVGPGRLKFIASEGKGSNVEDILVENNTLQGRSMDMIVNASDGARRARWTLRNNISDDTFGSPIGGLIRFTRIDGIEVHGNVNQVQTGRNMAGVLTDSSCVVNVSGNTFANATQEYVTAPYGCP